jgi:hypothetical protein
MAATATVRLGGPVRALAVLPTPWTSGVTRVVLGGTDVAVRTT